MCRRSLRSIRTTSVFTQNLRSCRTTMHTKRLVLYASTVRGYVRPRLYTTVRIQSTSHICEFIGLCVRLCFDDIRARRISYISQYIRKPYTPHIVALCTESQNHMEKTDTSTMHSLPLDILQRRGIEACGKHINTYRTYTTTCTVETFISH